MALSTELSNSGKSSEVADTHLIPAGRCADEYDMSSKPHENQDGGSSGSLQPLYSEYDDDADMAELIEFFVEELKGRLASIELAWQTGDETHLQLMAHQLKGAAACYGYPSITESAAVLERELLADEAELSALSEKVEDLVGLCRRAVASEG